jgi:hypothetical protein
MLEVTVNNELELGICFRKAAQSWLDTTIIYRYSV